MSDGRKFTANHVNPVIVTSFVHPPIPLRSYDWCAYRDGEEEKGSAGWGRTEAEAIGDLLLREDELEGI